MASSLKENLIHMKSQVYSGHMYKKAKTTQKDRRVKRERQTGQIETGSTFFPSLFIIDAYIIPAVVRIGLTAKLIFRSYKQALYDWII